MNERSNTVVIYGSYGYTGSLIALECKSKNIPVILAGRQREALYKQSEETGYPYEVVDVSDLSALKNLLQKGRVVIHCGGPFRFTAKAMVEACLETRTHYTDISGEYEVFDMLAEYGDRARMAGITIMPGAGFDVVPSDCLAMHLRNRLPSATHLQLAFAMSEGGMSRGTSRTTIEGLGKGSVIRKSNKLVSVPLGEKVLNVDFGSFKMKALNIPWGDISTAWHSTGIPNIEVYMGASETMIRGAKISKYLNWFLHQGWVKKYLKRKVDKGPAGPSDEKRDSGKSFLWGKAWDESGKICVSILKTINGYTLTAKTSVLIAENILRDNFKPGYQTPAMAYGPDFILALKNTVRTDIS